MFNPFDPETFKTYEEERKKTLERQQMTTDVNAHNVFGWIGGLDAEGLRSLKLIVGVFNNAPEKAAVMSMYYLGLVETLLLERHGECLACGQNHDLGLAGLVSPPNPAS